MYPKCFKSVHPRTYPRPDRFTWPVLIWRVVTNNYLNFSKLFAPEIIPNPTGLHGCFSFDVLSKQVPKVFPKYSPPKVSTPDRSICPFSHLTRCPKKYLTCFKMIRPRNYPKPDWCCMALSHFNDLTRCPKEYLKFSNLFASEIILHATGLHGSVSFDVLFTNVPKLFQDYSPQKWSQTRPIGVALSHLTHCPKKYLCFFKILRPGKYPNLDRFIVTRLFSERYSISTCIHIQILTHTRTHTYIRTHINMQAYTHLLTSLPSVFLMSTDEYFEVLTRSD